LPLCGFAGIYAYAAKFFVGQEECGCKRDSCHSCDYMPCCDR